MSAVHIDLTELVASPIRTGIQRVERELIQHWPADTPLVPVVGADNAGFVGQLSSVEGLQGAAVVVISRVAPQRGQSVGCQREKTRSRQAPRHIFDVGVKAPVFMDHQHRREGSVSDRLHQIPAHGVRRAAW